MNIFFTQKRRYIVHDSVENVRADIDRITNGEWDDFPENITGTINAENRFQVTQKWSLGIFHWIERNPAYLTGVVVADGDRTIIDTTLRPNSLLVIFIYLLIVLTGCEMVGIETFIQGPKEMKLITFVLFIIILAVIIKIFTTGLRKRFERLMHLRS